MIGGYVLRIPHAIYIRPLIDQGFHILYDPAADPQNDLSADLHDLYPWAAVKKRISVIKIIKYLVLMDIQIDEMIHDPAFRIRFRSQYRK